MNGKGDKRRKGKITQEQWDRIFPENNPPEPEDFTNEELDTAMENSNDKD